MEAVKKGLDKVLSWASVALFIVLVVVVVWQVLVRLVITKIDPGFTAGWTEELARITFVWLGFFATALVFSEKGHIAVDFVVRLLPVLGQRIVAIFVQLTILVFALLLLVWGGWSAAGGAMTQMLSSMPFLSMGQTYLVIPITGVIIAVYSLYHLVAILLNKEDALVGADDEVAAELARVAADESLAAERAALAEVTKKSKGKEA